MKLKKHPYYICAPDYVESSSGVKALHLLCDHLNRAGYEAYVAYANKFNPDLLTPALTNEIAIKHANEGKSAIAIYSDIYSGNPLGAPVVVRYMLNKEGVISGNKINSGEDDVFYYYSKAFAKSENSDILSIPTDDLKVFKEESQVEKKLCLLYLNRIPESAVDFSLLPDNIEILSNRNPLSIAELADKLKKTSVVYSFEFSGTLTLAMLCGCPVVIRNLPGYEKLGFNEQNLSVYEGAGYCFTDTDSDLERARNSTYKIKEILLRVEEKFNDQLSDFVKKTQGLASSYVPPVSQAISQWLAKRVLTKPSSLVFHNELIKKDCASSIALVSENIEASKKMISEITGNEAFSDTCGFMYYSMRDALTDLKNISADWVMLVQSCDELTYNGLLMAQIELSQNPSLSAISFDEVYRQEDGSLGAAFRPSGNLDYLLSFPAGMSRHWLFNRKALLDIGGFNPDLPDAFELDAILRLINKGGLECIGHIPEPLVITPSPVLANVEDERKAILSHLAERGYANAELHAPNPGRYQIRYNHPGQPVVSVVLAAGNNLSALQRCVEGLLGNTSYQNFEILFIEQPNSGVEVKEWLAGLAAMQEPKLRVFASNQTTLAQQYNEVGQHAIGDYLLFLSADTGIVSQHWLDEMLNHAQRGEVGVVGAKLLTPGGEIAHAGYILGLEGPVGSPFVGEPMDAPGYMQRLQVDQNLSAVSGDCLMVLRELFVQLDGFANGVLADDYLSTDLCLRAREAGFLIVWTPHAQLMLDKPKGTRPSAEQEDVMYERWLPQLARDPAYNPNFSLSMPGGFKLADTQISWRPLDSIRPAPVALVHPADLMGCGHYRVMQPFLAMKGEGLVDGAISTGLMHVTDLERYNPDCIVLQRQIGDARLEAMQRMQKFSRAVKVYELDDYLPNLPMKSVHRKDMPKDILRSLRRGLSFVDRFVVSTPALAEAFSSLHGEILVRENRLPTTWWKGLKTTRRQGKKPRVGWAGGSSHTGDLELITDVVRDLADEVEWVFFGMCPESLKPYVHEIHGGVAIEQYPAKLASLNLDVGVAPLEMNLFNECKSNLRQLEYGACGIPIICTDIRPYRDGLNAGLPVTLVKNRYKDWVEAIRMHINDLDATAKMADELQAKVLEDWMLQGTHLEQWRDAWLGR